jgi:uncharacterized membrane protein YjjP (DUF1212 family)
VKLPKAKPPKEKPRKPQPTPREKVQYGYRVTVPKELTRRGEQQALWRRMALYPLRQIRARSRSHDRLDWLAWGLAGLSGAAVCVIAFLPWFDVEWTLGVGAAGGTVRVTLFDLGPVGYAMLALAGGLVVAALAGATYLLRRAPVDAGAILLVLSLALLGLQVAVLVGNVGVIGGAGKISGLGGPYLGVYANVTKDSLITVYLAFGAMIIALSGALLRLAERKTTKEQTRG